MIVQDTMNPLMDNKMKGYMMVFWYEWWKESRKKTLVTMTIVGKVYDGNLMSRYSLGSQNIRPRQKEIHNDFILH